MLVAVGLKNMYQIGMYISWVGSRTMFHCWTIVFATVFALFLHSFTYLKIINYWNLFKRKHRGQVYITKWQIKNDFSYVSVALSWKQRYPCLPWFFCWGSPCCRGAAVCGQRLPGAQSESVSVGMGAREGSWAPASPWQPAGQVLAASPGRVHTLGKASVGTL